MNTSDISNPDLVRAYPDTTVDLWDENIVNGKYVIAYTMSSKLSDEIKNILPTVRCHDNFTHNLGTCNFDFENPLINLGHGEN